MPNQNPQYPTYPTNPVKHLIKPVAAGRMPLYNEDLLTLQEAPLAVLKGIFAGLGNYFIIEGGLIRDLDTDAGTVELSSGLAWIDGEIRYFPGFYGGYPLFLVSGNDQRTQKTFGDGNQRDVYVQHYAHFASTPGTGQAIRFSPEADYRYHDLTIARSTTAINTLNTNVAALQAEIKVPVGGIIMWADTLIPNGWALCDGQNGRPDLRGQFVVGYDSGNPDYDAVGKTGGANTVSLTEDQNGPHSHTTTGQVFSGSVTFDSGSSGAQATNWNNHNTGTVSSSGYGLPHENRPPYYVLCYIIRVL